MEKDDPQSSGDKPQPFSIPAEMPVMVLPNCFLFPGCFLPLFIFEERYRQMLAHALSTNRMFCIGARKRAEDSGDDISPVSTAGLIRACVKGEDGTSHLMLYGVGRIRLKGWVQERPFRIAAVEPILTKPGDPDALAEMRLKAIGLIPEMPGGCQDTVRSLRQMLEGARDPELVCDLLSYHFVHRPAVLRQLLAEQAVQKRYNLLLGELEKLRG